MIQAHSQTIVLAATAAAAGLAAGWLNGRRVYYSRGYCDGVARRIQPRSADERAAVRWIRRTR